MKINIYKMSLTDLNSIKSVLTSDFDNFWNFETLKEELNSDFSEFFIAKNEHNQIIGFVGLKIVFDEADIMNIVVKKSLRNMGIGSYLLNYIIQFAIDKKIASISLEVNETNKFAISLYKKFGFKCISIRRKYYKDGDALIMKKILY